MVPVWGLFGGYLLYLLVLERNMTVRVLGLTNPVPNMKLWLDRNTLLGGSCFGGCIESLVIIVIMGPIHINSEFTHTCTCTQTQKCIQAHLAKSQVACAQNIAL